MSKWYDAEIRDMDFDNENNEIDILINDNIAIAEGNKYVTIKVKDMIYFLKMHRLIKD